MTGAGTIDLGAKSLAFRVEPKLVMTTEGQGRAADPVGLGIPVVIDGPWAEPRIYPDMAGILDNPDAAYAKLKEMGKGLFGGDGGALERHLADSAGSSAAEAGGNGTNGSSDPLGGQLGETLGNLIQQGLGQQPQSAQPTGPPARRHRPRRRQPIRPPRRPGQRADEGRAEAAVQPLSDVGWRRACSTADVHARLAPSTLGGMPQQIPANHAGDPAGQARRIVLNRPG